MEMDGLIRARITSLNLPVGSEEIRLVSWRSTAAAEVKHDGRAMCPRRRRVSHNTEEKTKTTTSSAYSKRYGSGWAPDGLPIGPIRWASVW
jgi:hypothetical protein